MKNNFLTSILYIAFAVLLVSCSNSYETEYVETRPNILVIITDDQGYADYSKTGLSSDVSTPSIDKIAESGVMFMQGYATSSICSPSRAGLVSGRYQQRWGNHFYGQGGLPDSEITIPEKLKEVGYRTIKIGKTHYSLDAHNEGDTLMETHPTQHGFDEYFGFNWPRHDYFKMKTEYAEALREGDRRFPDWGPLFRNNKKVDVEGYTTEVFTDEAIKYIKSDSQQPFYMQISYNAIHEPMGQVPQKYLDKYDLEPIEEFDPTGDEKYSDFHLRRHWAQEPIKDSRKYYLAVLDCLDENIGRILNELEKSGKRENTIIFFVSDNGGSHNMAASNGPLSGHKYHLMEGGIRVPFIVSYPGVLPEGMRNDTSLVSALDIFPTALSAAGVDYTQAETDGNDLITLYHGGEAHNTLFWDSGWEYAVRHGNWKLRHVVISRTFPNFKEDSAVYLYNLKEDIGERNNLQSKNPDKTEELMKLYQTWKSKF